MQRLLHRVFLDAKAEYSAVSGLEHAAQDVDDEDLGSWDDEAWGDDERSSSGNEDADLENPVTTPDDEKDSRVDGMRSAIEMSRIPGKVERNGKKKGKVQEKSIFGGFDDDEEEEEEDDRSQVDDNLFHEMGMEPKVVEKASAAAETVVSRFRFEVDESLEENATPGNWGDEDIDLEIDLGDDEGTLEEFLQG